MQALSPSGDTANRDGLDGAQVKCWFFALPVRVKGDLPERRHGRDPSRLPQETLIEYAMAFDQHPLSASLSYRRGWRH